MASALHRTIGTIPIIRKEGGALSLKQRKCGKAIRADRCLCIELLELFFQRFRGSKGARSALSVRSAGADFGNPVHIAKRCGLPFVGLCGAAGSAGLGEGRGLGKRF